MKENEFDIREPSSPAVMRTNKRARAVLIFVLLAGTLMGAAALQWLLPYSGQYVSQQQPQAALRTLQILIAFLFLSVLPLGVYLFWFGYRAVRWRQIPPPGTWVIRDTNVVEGPRAQQRGRIILAMGVLLFALGLSCAIYFPHRLGRVFPGAPAEPAAESTQPAQTR